MVHPEWLFQLPYYTEVQTVNKKGKAMNSELHLCGYFVATASKIVLGYMANKSWGFHVYVANQIQEIKDKTSLQQWRYVETKSNPADRASQGLCAQDISNSKWILEPKFLWKKDNQRQETMSGEEIIADKPLEQDPDVKTWQWQCCHDNICPISNVGRSH